VSEYIIELPDCVVEKHMALTGQPPQSFHGQPLTGELVRCRDCVNWDSEKLGYLADFCPAVRKCTHPNDWCCWGYEKDEEVDDES